MCLLVCLHVVGPCLPTVCPMSVLFHRVTVCCWRWNSLSCVNGPSTNCDLVYWRLSSSLLDSRPVSTTELVMCLVTISIHCMVHLILLANVNSLLLPNVVEYRRALDVFQWNLFVGLFVNTITSE